MPDLPGEDHRGAVRPAAHRATRGAEPVAAHPRVIIVSGPSGAGKGTLIKRLLPQFGWIATAISATTRRRRPGEVDGHHYYFLTDEEFDRRVEAGEFLEHVEYAGNRYGTLRSELERILAEGRAPLVEIELRGARAVRASIPGALAVFIAPPSVEELARRLEHRATDSPDEIAARMRTSEIELQARNEFDHVIVNDDVERATAELAAAVAGACGARVDEPHG